MESQAVTTRNPLTSNYDSGNRNNGAVNVSRETLTANYTSKDGDTLQLNYTRIEASIYTKPSSKAFEMSPEEGAQFRNTLKSELYSYKEALIKSFIESQGGSYKAADAVENSDPELDALEASMPSYWNAENTSQRIVDFATSFLSSFKGDNKSEFFKIIKAAIEDGFKQAGDILGELPGATGKLTQKTHQLVMDKLDAIEKQVSGLSVAEGNGAQVLQAA